MNRSRSRPYKYRVRGLRSRFSNHNRAYSPNSEVARSTLARRDRLGVHSSYWMSRLSAANHASASAFVSKVDGARWNP
ncbi:hypothetical protein M3697_12425 [Janibacter melonis]|uniref:hypothetical protein n=1 Tax=Janibacter melonis TaxID=262209 RepID=UPI0020445893|nr:hypothetical protein [Janibacter melonis]MCM3555902.1 hypothetical protein [Janibacter melonis]